MQLDYRRIETIDKIDSHEERILAAAKFYAESGFYVIPIRKNGKAIPPTHMGIQYPHATKNVETVEKWFTGKFAGWNIGLCCGAEDGIFVLDVDNDDDKNGFEPLAEMIDDHGEIHTLTQSTPSGGEHYVFMWFDNGRSSTSKIARGIDTRGGDGTNKSHIVAWPSTINGKRYTWKNGGKAIQAPDWLEDLLGVPWDSTPRGTGRGNEEVEDDHLETQFTPNEIWRMLKHINPDGLEYDEWVKIGQAIHSQFPDETGLKLWDKWSSTGDRYLEDECRVRWSGFKAYGPIRVATLIYYAKEGGYVTKPQVMDLKFDGTKSEYEVMIEEMNKEFGIAVVGGKLRILATSINADPDQDVQLLGMDDFKTLTMNQKVVVETSNGSKAVPKSQIWLSDENRKEYRGGIHFRPDKNQDFESDNGLCYNMWRGWQTQPEEGSWEKLKTHIVQVLCSGNEEHSTWVLDWMADMFQDPANPKGCAIVMHGIEGCGKGTFMEALGRTIGRHYKHVTQEAHLTGNFNGHLQDALLVFADEVTYGGSRKTAGTLKAMVTERKLTVERKGVDAYSFRNCARLGIASNEDWFIPAGPQSRRWFVLDVSPEKAQQQTWFAPIYEEMNNGGIEAMMHELMEREITTDLSVAPETDALQKQRERFLDSRLDSIEAWWYDALEVEALDVVCHLNDDMEETVWPLLVSKPDIYEDYRQWCVGSGRDGSPKSKSLFYSRMQEFGCVDCRPSSDVIKDRFNGKRPRMYEMPPIEVAKLVYTKITGKEL